MKALLAEWVKRFRRVWGAPSRPAFARIWIVSYERSPDGARLRIPADATPIATWSEPVIAVRCESSWRTP